MRILVVSPFFPPSAMAEAYVSAKFVQTLLHMGHHVQVITCRDSWATDSSVMWSDLEQIVLDVPAPTGRSKVKRILHGIRYRTNSFTAWVPDMIKAARSLHQKFSFDLILSRALPWRAHWQAIGSLVNFASHGSRFAMTHSTSRKSTRD